VVRSFEGREIRVHWFSGIVGEYGGWALFFASFVGNMGLPIPAFPVLMLAGALSLEGGLSIPGAVVGAAAGASSASALWYHLGRKRGRKVLFTLCRMSLNPDACMERAIFEFHRRPSTMVLFSKFLPGVNSIVPPVAGIVSMPLYRFLILGMIGASLWAGAGVGLGWAFGVQIVRRGGEVYGALGWILAGGCAAFFAWRAAYRYHLVHRFSVPRLQPLELHRRMTLGEDPLLLDLRIDLAFDNATGMLPGARRIRPATFQKHVHELPHDRELVFYCT
jgi:membrane protein DedA with SNARE-associated domain